MHFLLKIILVMFSVGVLGRFNFFVSPKKTLIETTAKNSNSILHRISIIYHIYISQVRLLI